MEIHTESDKLKCYVNRNLPTTEEIRVRQDSLVALGVEPSWAWVRARNELISEVINRFF